MKIRVSLMVLLALVAALSLLSGWGRSAGAAAHQTMSEVDGEPAMAVGPERAAADSVLTDEESAVGETGSGQGSSGGASGTPSAGESPPSAAGELEEIVPSERVPADSAISFPVDI